MTTAQAERKKTVGLFVTCLADFMRPTVARAALQLLEGAGFRVVVPAEQACCGQPAWNSGFDDRARDIARGVVAAFEGFDYVVLPSGSCAGMIRKHYPEAFGDDLEYADRAVSLAAKTYELTSFLVSIAGWGADDVRRRLDSGVGGKAVRAYYHDSCAGLRELGIKNEPRALLSGCDGVTLAEGAEAETCCGFGGLFCIKYADISATIADHKIDDIVASKADTLLGGDMGCLMQLQGRLSRLGHDIDVRHVAEVLAGETTPAIGKTE